MEPVSVTRREGSLPVAERDRFRLDVGGRLMYVREKLAGLSPAAFARSLGVGKSSVLRYELGERTPDAWYIAQVASRFGVSADWLTRGDPARPDGASAPHDGPSGCLDRHLLSEVLLLVETWTLEHDLHLPPRKKRELILLTYDEWALKDADAARHLLIRILALLA